MSQYFEGWYFKHQKDGDTLTLIPGRSAKEAFIQVVTNGGSYYAAYGLNEYTAEGIVKVGGSGFSRRGVTLDIHTPGLELTGELVYHCLTPVTYDIMGPFRFIPMECRHSVISMNHSLSGVLLLNGRRMDFDGGKGYIEGDRGRSFPKNYTWAQCNAFGEECSVMASAALIPLAGLKFWGCTCAAVYCGAEYRLATYKGARISHRSKNALVITQGAMRLIVEAGEEGGHGLYAPERGAMSRTIYENPSCKARFCLTDKDRVIFDMASNCASFEYA